LAADFKFENRNGSNGSLLSTKYTGYLMLIFYDPDCDECKETLAGLSQNNMLNDMIAERLVTVLAVCTEGEKHTWQCSLSDLPNSWTVTYDISGINENNIYILRAMPTIYILDENHRIVGKDVLADQALQILEQSQQ
jgi:thioredoxin-related protein